MELEGYTNLKLIQRSQSGTLYQATLPGNNKPLALKLIPNQVLRSLHSRALLLEEGHYISQLRDPSIASVYEVREYQGGILIASDYMNAKSLQHRARDLCLLDQLYVVTQLLHTLDKLQEQSFGHYNLKPSNIFLSENGQRILVTDFWLRFAAQLSFQPASAIQSLQSAAYASPELLANEEPDVRSDIYSTGILLYQLITGGLPYQANSIEEFSAKHQGAPIPKLPKTFASFQAVINQALAKHPENRFQSTQEMRSALSLIGDEEIIAMQVKHSQPETGVEAEQTPGLAKLAVAQDSSPNSDDTSLQQASSDKVVALPLRKQKPVPAEASHAIAENKLPETEATQQRMSKSTGSEPNPAKATEPQLEKEHQPDKESQPEKQSQPATNAQPDSSRNADSRSPVWRKLALASLLGAAVLFYWDYQNEQPLMSYSDTRDNILRLIKTGLDNLTPAKREKHDTEEQASRLHREAI